MLKNSLPFTSKEILHSNIIKCYVCNIVSFHNEQCKPVTVYGETFEECAENAHYILTLLNNYKKTRDSLEVIENLTHDTTIKDLIKLTLIEN